MNDEPDAPRRPLYVEDERGRILHRAEPLMFILALLVIPAVVLEEARSEALRDAAFVLYVVIWVGFAVEPLENASRPLA